jgi:uncharacterized protein
MASNRLTIAERLLMAQPTQTELEAAAFRTLVAHLRERTDVQNIDLMNLAGFCRNCLSKWYRAAAEEGGAEMSYEDAREEVYGMPYAQWKSQFQAEASPEQLDKMRETMAREG